MVPDWVVVADDLTGALDTAAALAGGGDAQVVLDADGEWPDARVLAVSTRSRDEGHDVARRRTAAAVQRALALEARVFLKIDSLLRGPVGPVVAAALGAHRAGSARLAVVAPAFPATGRTTRGGRLVLTEEPGAEGRDLAAALAAVGLRVRVVDRAEALADGGSAEPAEALVVDCATDDDLARVAAAAAALPGALLVGTAGLAAQLAGTAPPRSAPPVPAASGRSLGAIGSFAPQAAAQVAAAVLAGARQVVVSPAPLAAGRKAAGLLAAGPVVLTPDQRVRHPDPIAVAAGLADAVEQAVGEADLLVLSGGHTAQVVLDRLGVTRLVDVVQLAPGVVASTMPGRRQTLVTKAGAFGADDALLRLIAPAASVRERNPT
ncbi:four-carbon acid sugar kinase family protein [Amnibacterium kyonggiense]